jgi:hypothetical protein
LLNKANPKKAFGLSRSHQSLMKAALDQDHLLVFIDEAHIHLIPMRAMVGRLKENALG